MKRSFGSSKGMGGGGMQRAAGRAVGTGIGGAIQSIAATRPSKPTNPPSLSSQSPYSSVSFPVSASTAVNGWTSSLYFIDDANEGWESIEEEEVGGGGDTSDGFKQRFGLGPVPSKDEVEDAVSALQRVIVPCTYSQIIEDGCPSTPKKDASCEMMDSAELMCRISSSQSKLDWIEPVLHLYNPKALKRHGYDSVVDALQLLQKNPSVQRMVISLSSAKAIWDAVMNNEVVQELRNSFYADHPPEKQPMSSKKTFPEVSMKFLRWVLDNTNAKVLDFLSKIMKLASNLFQATVKRKAMDVFEYTLKSSLMLSILVLLVIVAMRVPRN